MNPSRSFRRLLFIFPICLSWRLAPAAPVSSVPVSVKYDVHTYHFEGDTILPPEKLATLMAGYTGRVDLVKIHAGLDNLQEFYRLNDLTNVFLAMPRQPITNGVVRVQIFPSRATALTAIKPPPAPLNIRGYHIEGNTVLPPSDFGVLTNYTGTNLDFARLREGLGQLQLRYREFGYSTINVTLPQQRLTNGVVHVKVVEGKLVDIHVTGNHWFSTANVRRALPGLTTNILLNNKWFQPELDLANANNDRQIYPIIEPGPDPGTSALELKVKDQLPLHGRVEVNDKSTPGTPLLRLDTSIQYANLWQLNHQLGIDYNFSPQAYKDGNDTEVPLDSPRVATYSGFYRIPFGTSHSQREDLENQPANFGYDEVSHQFNLPPPTGHPDVTFFASRSSSDTALNFGPRTLIFSNTLAEIGSQSVQHTPTINNDLGVKATVPFERFLGIQSSAFVGLDFKTFDSDTDSTNLTYFNLYALDSLGNRQLVTNEVIRLSANSVQSLYYLPLSYGWSGWRPDASGSFSFSYSQNIFLRSLASPRSDFQDAAGDVHAGGNDTTINAGMIRQQNLPGNWSASLNLNGQWASAPLINNEQMELGGSAGVRGFQEGEAYGDEGWRSLFDLHAPPVNVGYLQTPTGEVPAILRCSVFMDYGQLFELGRPALIGHHLYEWGSGLSFLLTAGSHFDARLTLAWALDGAAVGPGDNASHVYVQTSPGSAQAYFTVGAQF